MTLTPPREVIDWRTKGLWWPGEPVPLAEFAAARHPLFGGPFSWPVMVARKTAIEGNIGTLAAFCERHDLRFAPHGKTTMAPSLFEAQLKAGAWGIAVATANQVLACRAFGVPRILLANELLDPAALRWIAGEIADGLEFWCFVDSVAGVMAIAEAVAGGRSPHLLVELGYPGGRTGCRSIAELVVVARTVAAQPGLRPAGVAGYEGELGSPAEVAGYLADLWSAARMLREVGLLPADTPVTVGGSGYFDLVAQRPPDLPVILLSGAYVSHDHGLYRAKTPFTRIPGTLDAALELWAQVLSVPEGGLAIVGMGKRDAPHDAGLPSPLRVRRRDGATEPATGLRVAKLNDHHAYVEGDGRLAPGDLLCFGISHPCTAFDKWQVIPVVDDDYRVTDLIRTYF